jgi:hypothetical protein
MVCCDRRANQPVAYQLAQLLFLLVADDKLDTRQALKVARRQLGIAAGGYQAGIRVLAMHAAQGLTRLLRRDMCHSTGVKNAQISLCRGGDDLVSSPGQLGGQGIDFALVQLAANAADVYPHGVLVLYGSPVAPLDRAVVPLNRAALHCTISAGGSKGFGQDWP